MQAQGTKPTPTVENHPNGVKNPKRFHPKTAAPGALEKNENER